VKVESADQMYREVEKRFNRSDGVIMAAAVADYSPTKKSDIKIKKGADKLNISFKKTVDILGELGRKKGEKILVGFAVESQSLEDYAIEKLKRKNLDMIVANQVDAMGSDKNTVLIIKKDGTLKRVGPDEKERIALAVLTELADFWSRSRGNS